MTTPNDTTTDLAERAATILGDAADGSPMGDLAAALDEVERLRREMSAGTQPQARAIPPTDGVGYRLRMARYAAKMTQGALGRRCGVVASAVSYWERGVTKPTAAHLRSAASALGVTVEWLKTGEGDAPHDDERIRGLMAEFGVATERDLLLAAAPRLEALLERRRLRRAAK